MQPSNSGLQTQAARAGRPLCTAVLALIVAAVAVTASAVFVKRLTDYGRGHARDDLAETAATAAAALDPQQVGRLQGSAADTGSATLHDIRLQLRRIQDTVPHVRFVYLVTLRNDQIIFLADAEATDSADYSPPGQVYDDAPAVFGQTFASGQPTAYGPYTDHWGDWFTGLAAIGKAGAGPAQALLGVDVSAGHYLEEVSSYRNFAMTIAGLFLTVLSLASALFWMMRRYNVRLQSDLAELQRAHERLKLAAAVIENVEEGVMITDASLKIESVNPAFERVTGYAAAEAVGHSPKILFSGKHDDAFFQQLHERVDAQGNWRGEIWNRRRNGDLYPQRTLVSVLRDAAGNIRHYAALLSDNTVQHLAEQKLREMSAIDGLTGIANRRSFDEVLAREWARALRDGRPLSLIMADIDYFKIYNDRHGHLGGDRCLQQVAKAIEGAVNRASDFAARYGGEEFAVILPQADAAAAAQMAERVRAAVAALALPHGGSDAAAIVTISLGVATVLPRAADRSNSLIGAADSALYQAKRSGRNRSMSAAAEAETAAAAILPAQGAGER